MLPAPNSRLLLSLVITAALVVSATVLACSDESSLGVESPPPNTVQDPTVVSCDPLEQSDVAPCESEVDDGKESSQYLESLTTNSYFVGTVEPCAQLTEFDADPCERRFDDWDVVRTPYRSTYIEPVDPPTVEGSLSRLFGVPWHVPHLIVRGTIVPGTTRCEEQSGILLSAFGNDADAFEAPWDTCFAELRVGEYIVGRGPSEITVEVGGHDKVYDYGDHDGDEYYAWLEGIHSVFEGSEWVVGLKVPIDFYFSVWTMNHFPWDVQRTRDGELVVVDWWARHQSQLSREENGFEISLDEFRALAKRMHADHLASHGGRTGQFEGAPFVLNDANYEFLHRHMSHGPVFSIVDATPRAAPPPP